MRNTLFLFLCLLLGETAAADLPRPSAPLWRPVQDDVYLQETGWQLKTEKPLTAVAVRGDDVFVGSQVGVQRLSDHRLVAAGGPKSPVGLLRVLRGDLWAGTTDSLWRYDGGGWSQIAAGAFVDICLHVGEVVAVTPTEVLRLRAGRFEPITGVEARRPILGVASYAETVYVRHASRLGFLRAGRFEYEDLADWGQLPWGSSTRDMMAMGSRLLVATDRGLGVLRGSAWTAWRGKDGLCYEDTTCLARGFADDTWVGTTRGVVPIPVELLI